MADISGTPRERKLAALLAVVIVAVTFLNGAGVFLKRTGLMDRPAYEQYFELHRKGISTPDWRLTTPRYLREQVYQTGSEGSAVVLKLLKDGVIVVLVTLSAICLARRVTALPTFRCAWPGYLLAGLTAALFLLTLQHHGILLPLTGLHAFSFLYLALLAGWLAKRTFTAALAAAAGALLVLETAAVSFEALRGLPMYGNSVLAANIPARLFGTFDLPNSLGIFAVLAVAFYFSYSPEKRLVWPLCLLAILLVFGSGSATGCMVLAFLGAGAALRRMKTWWRITVPVCLVVIAALFMSLPHLLGRPDLFYSLIGRTGELSWAYTGLEGWEIITGKAFGAGTNAAFQLFRVDGPCATADCGRIYTASAESLPTLLLLGTGLPGLLAFYLLLLWAAIKDPRGRPFFVAVVITSLTGKVVEIFPVNLFIAAALARAFATIPERDVID